MQGASSDVRWQSIADLLHSILHGKSLVFGNLRIDLTQLQAIVNKGFVSVATVVGLEQKQSV